MKKLRERIQRTGKTLKVICKIVRIVMYASMGLAVAGVIESLFSDELMRQTELFFRAEGVMETIADITFLADLPLRAKVAISGLIHILTRGILAFFLYNFEKILAHISSGEQPFREDTAKKLRVLSFWMLIFIVYNPLMGMLIFLIGMLFANLFEYGAYLQEKADETNRIQEEMIVSFAEIIENKSGQTGQHIRRVSEYSRILALQMGLSGEEAENVRLASTMHDIGKLIVPTEILEKPGRLTDEEYTEIKKHSGYGGELLESVEGDVMGLARKIALDHHERVDGKGYPEGKKGSEISLEGRIVAVADVYDALTSKRSYKEAWDEQRAYEEIVKGRGTQFDSGVVKAFQKAYPRIRAVREQFADNLAVERNGLEEKKMKGADQ